MHPIVSMIKSLAVAAVLCCATPVGARAAATFCDRFAGPSDPNWGNQRGTWRISHRQYDATNPNNSPATYTDLVNYQNLENFTVFLTVNDLNDGGVWLRSNWNNGAINGILLVTGGEIGSFNGFYWHVVTSGTYGPMQTIVSVPGVQGSTLPIKIIVSGNTYRLYLGSSKTPITTLVDDTYKTGSVGLYDFSPTSGASSPRGETFSNFCLLIP